MCNCIKNHMGFNVHNPTWVFDSRVTGLPYCTILSFTFILAFSTLVASGLFCETSIQFSTFGQQDPLKMCTVEYSVEHLYQIHALLIILNQALVLPKMVLV